MLLHLLLFISTPNKSFREVMNIIRDKVYHFSHAVVPKERGWGIYTPIFDGHPLQ